MGDEINKTSVQVKELVYIKASDVYCELYTVDGKSHIRRKSLLRFEEELAKDGFIRVHRSYLVNMHFIKKIDDDFIDLGIAEVKMAVRMKGIVKAKYKEFCRGNGKI